MSTAWDHLTNLLRFGSRPIGSEANQAAADQIAAIFRACNLDVSEQPYPCTAWDHTITTLKVDRDILEATANPFSLPCDVTSPIVRACTLDELDSLNAQGKILLLYGDLARAPISPKSWFLIDERDTRLIERLEMMKPAAILAPYTATDYVGQLFEDWEFDIPSATIKHETANKLIHLETGIAHLRIDAQRRQAISRNVIARTRKIADQRVVICAHFDTKIKTPGASDNGAGVAILLSLAEQFANETFPFGIEFVAFNGEEYLPLGDDEYLRQSESYFKDIIACINMDGGGTALGTTSVTMMSAPEELEARARDVAKQFSSVAWIEPWPESNHSTFAFRGVPSIAISAVGTRSLAHSMDDDQSQMSEAKMLEIELFVKKLLTIFG